MRGFFQNLAYKFQGFMIGRNGDDELNHLLVPIAFGMMVVSLILRYFYPPLIYLDYVGLILMLYCMFRMLSKNTYKRQKENAAYVKFLNARRSRKRLRKTMWEERNEFSYFKCTSCKTYVRIKKPPKGKKIAITCKKCSNEFIVRT